MFMSVFILKYPIDLSLQKDFSYYLSFKVQKEKNCILPVLLIWMIRGKITGKKTYFLILSLTVPKSCVLIKINILGFIFCDWIIRKITGNSTLCPPQCSPWISRYLFKNPREEFVQCWGDHECVFFQFFRTVFCCLYFMKTTGHEVPVSS